MNTYTEAYIDIHAYFICRYAYLQMDILKAISTRSTSREEGAGKAAVDADWWLYLILFVQTIQNSRGLSFYHILSDIPPAKFLQTTWPPSSTITTTYTWGYYRPGSKTVAFFIGNSSESRNDIFGQTLAQERDACITRITFW